MNLTVIGSKYVGLFTTNRRQLAQVARNRPAGHVNEHDIRISEAGSRAPAGAAASDVDKSMMGKAPPSGRGATSSQGTLNEHMADFRAQFARSDADQERMERELGERP